MSRHLALRLVASLPLIAMLGGCSSGPRPEDVVLQSYRVGMTRDEVRAVMAKWEQEPRATATRPAAGWTATGAQPEADPRIARIANDFEIAQAGTIVQRCDLHWIERHTSMPVDAGAWFDCLCFDGDDKLVGFRRELGGTRTDEMILASYRVGMSHDELRSVLRGAQPMESASRPPTGWSAAADTGWRLNRLAQYFEGEQPGTIVQSCDVYWIGRHTSMPIPPGGVWADYVCFDAEDKVMGFRRKFLD